MADAAKHDPSSQPHPRVLKICTDAWPERDRVAMFHETFGRDRIRVAPAPDEALEIDVTLLKLPGLGLLSGRRSALRSDFADGHDRIIFTLGSAALAKQFGREVVLEPGDAVALSGADWGSLTTSRAGPIATLEFPHGGLVPMLKDAGVRCAQRLPGNSPALRLLLGYLDTLFASGRDEPGVRRLAVAHVHDLAALALGAAREAEEIARGRGLRVARLRAIKTDIHDMLHRGISLAEIAARHRLTPRYVRMLFESEGTSFTEYVCEERLQRARAKLRNRGFDHLRISAIAYEVGFNDLSYFNRAFRRRFGCSPGEFRRLSSS